MGANADRPRADDAIRAAAARVQGWDADAIEVGTVEKLDRDGCRFYRASHPGQLDASPVEFAVLPDGRVVGGDRDAAKQGIGDVLKACGETATADWWAQVVSRYAGTGGVVVDDDAPSAIRRIRGAGIADHAPSLRQDGTSTVLTYFSHDYERSRTQAVTATLDAAGALSVESREVGAGDAGG